MTTGIQVCTQCGFTYAEFQSRGLLGCPECYACFDETLWSDLLQLHPGLFRKPNPLKLRYDGFLEENQEGYWEALARLKEMLADALRQERYEEAAVLRIRIQVHTQTKNQNHAKNQNQNDKNEPRNLG